MWVLLVPWLAALERTVSLRGALASGLAAALIFSVAVFAWFPVAMADYAAVPLWIAATIGAVLTPLFQPQFVVFALVRTSVRRRGLGAAGTAVVGASAWVATEWLLPKLFGDTLGIGLYPSRVLRQAADLAGLGGLTLVVVLVNESLYDATAAVWRGALRRAAAALALAVAAIAALALYGERRLADLASAPAAEPLRFGVVQADVAHYDRLAAEVGTYEAVRQILDAHFTLSEEVLTGGPVDAVVWPETVYPTTFGTPKSADGAAFDAAIAGFARRADRPLIFGSYDAEGGQEYNAAIFLEPGHADDASATFATYRKASLFPLTERVPGWLDGPLLRSWLPWVGSWRPGEGAPVVDLRVAGRTLRVAPLICYDAVDPRNVARAVRAGASLILTLSNDSWLADGAGARLHLVVSAFRSVETRRAQVRATTTGISAAIDPTGELVATLGVHQRGVLTASLTPRTGDLPPAVRSGEWLGPAATLLALAGVIAARATCRAPLRAAAARSTSAETRS